jgi:hypothetical protein
LKSETAGSPGDESDSATQIEELANVHGSVVLALFRLMTGS